MEQEHAAPSTDFRLRVKAWLGLLKSAGQAWSRDKALRLAAALAYYSVFSIAPLLVISLGMAGYFLGEKAATGQLYDTMQEYIGSRAASAVQAMVESASRPRTGIVATVIGFATLLLGASGVLGQLKDALNTVWEVEVKKGTGIGHLVLNRFLNFGMVLVIGLLLLMSLVLTSWLAAISQSMQQVLALPAWVWPPVTTVASAGMVMTLFAMLFKFLPDACIRWRDVWMGAAITAVLFEIGKTALGWYLGRESTADAYGPAGSVVLLILWVYYASCILLYGAEFTQVYAASTGRAIEPSSHAQRVSRYVPSKEESVPVCRENLPARSEAPPRPLEETPPPVFRHRLMGPVLKYFEGRGMLLSIEAKEALSQAIVLVVAAAVCCVTLFVAWTLLALALVGFLTNEYEWNWLKAVAVVGAGHLMVALAAGVLIWHRAVHGAWFTETFNELRKDRTWLKGH